MRERRGMERLDLPPAFRPERHHAAIADARRLTVERFADPERILNGALLLVQTPADPALPARLALARRVATRITEDSKRGVVEPRRSFEIVRAQADVGEHGFHRVASSIRTSAIQLRRRRASRSSRSSALKLAG